jgi:nucleotide-binding universal stress UspA family protein
VPNGVAFKQCSNILYATDEKATDQMLVERVPAMMGCPNANVHFVHVNEVDDGAYKVEDLCFKNPALTGQFHFVQIESKDVLEGLNRYTKEEKIDAMVMATPRRSFLEGLFHKSMTKQMALNTNMPLLVMHYGDQ